jgi:hypothetical protein
VGVLVVPGSQAAHDYRTDIRGHGKHEREAGWNPPGFAFRREKEKGLTSSPA